MKKLLIFSLVVASLACSKNKRDETLVMWYDSPATEWVEALPLGNGRLGAMVFGGTESELIQLNEETLWAGGPVDPNPNPEAVKYLQPVRKALFDNNYALAEELCKKMQGYYTESYAPLGDLAISQKFKGEISDYRRELDLNTAVASTTFSAGNTNFSREIFVSEPDQVIVIKFKADQKEALNFDAVVGSQLKSSLNIVGNNTLVIDGKAPAHADPDYLGDTPEPIVYKDDEGMRFRMTCRIINKDGTVSADQAGLHLQNATEAVLVLSAATSFNGFDKHPYREGRNEKAVADNFLNKASAKEYKKLKKEHIEDYRKYFTRVDFDPNNAKTAEIPTKSLSKRLDDYLAGKDDPALERLYFQFNRYLLISSSRPGGIANNLQGIWNKDLRPPWSANYTTNINLPMNYWPAEVSNLAEMHEPMLKQIKNMSKTGAATARNFYNMNGWCLHHNSDIWAQTNPVGNHGTCAPVCANWMVGGAWVSQHLYEHYRFGGDTEYLKNFAYPIMKGAGEFLAEWLIEDNQGRLITAPSTSPENFFLDSDNNRRQVAVAATCDMVLIWDLFTNLIEASEILGIDEEFRRMLIEKRSRLYPLQVGSRGQLQEWLVDFKEAEPHHRHMSHMIGLHPGRQISPLTTPDLAKACRKTIELRGDDGTGWALSWRINLWARLLEGDRAYTLFRNLLRVTDNNVLSYGPGGGSYRNLLCAHPPFQIDGNFGGLAGVCEMLLQSHMEEIHLLPALPSVWKIGSIKGLRARGGFEVNMKWADNQLERAEIFSSLGKECTIRTNIPVTIKDVKYVTKEHISDGKTYYLTTFSSQKGNRYLVTPKTNRNKSS